jgi:hypothetical protein
MTQSEYMQAIENFDPRIPNQGRSTAERQLAMDAFIASVRDTDDATQAEIEAGIDQMLEHIYSARTLADAPIDMDAASTGA